MSEGMSLREVRDLLYEIAAYVDDVNSGEVGAYDMVAALELRLIPAAEAVGRAIQPKVMWGVACPISGDTEPTITFETEKAARYYMRNLMNRVLMVRTVGEWRPWADVVDRALGGQQ